MYQHEVPVVRTTEGLHPALAMAVAWQPEATRPMLSSMLAFDAHLGGLIARAQEPLLAQMRLAWWREQIARPPAGRAAGEPILAALRQHWTGAEPLLSALVDGWEELLGDPPLDADGVSRFAAARGMALGEFAARASGEIFREPATGSGRRWALADFAFRTSHPIEREQALREAWRIDRGEGLPRSLRGLSVLAALADRAITREEPLAHGRKAALVALRVGLTGR